MKYGLGYVRNVVHCAERLRRWCMILKGTEPATLIIILKDVAESGAWLLSGVLWQPVNRVGVRNRMGDIGAERYM